MGVTIDGMGKRLTIALVVFALVAVPLAIYVVGYFGLCASYDEVIGEPVVIREYRYPWQVAAFGPAAWVEELVTGRSVMLDLY